MHLDSAQDSKEGSKVWNEEGDSGAAVHPPHTNSLDSTAAEKAPHLGEGSE